MALLRGKVSDIPTDAVILSKEEALNYEMNILYKWKKASDVFAIKYGGAILGFGSLFVGAYANSYFRRKFKLLLYGRFTTYLPATVIPAMFSYTLHQELVVKDVVLNSACPICLELRAVALQTTLGCFLPIVLSQLSSLSLASRYGTVNLPLLSQQPLEVLKLVVKKTKPIKNTLIGIFLAQAVLASVVTYMEQKSVETVNNRLMELQYELENSDLLKK